MASEIAVLVVDDDPSLRLVCRINLEVAGCRVHEAGSLEQARSVLAAELVDVVVLDVHIGPENGVQFLGELRRDRPRLPVAMLTGTAELRTVREAGPDAVLGKPFDLDELRTTVERLAAFEAVSD